MARADIYVFIPNWDGPDGFQHYKGRDPIWIKNYTRLLAHDEYLDLTLARRGILHGLWLEYASSARRLPGDTRSLSRRLGQKITSADLEALNHAGFIELLASDALAARAQDASNALALTRAGAPSRDQTREETPSVSSSHVTGARATSAAAGRTPANGKRPAVDIAIDRVRNVGAELPLSDLTAELRDALDQRYDELTDDQLVELRDLHAHLAKETT